MAHGNERQAIDTMVAEGQDPGPLAGVPVAVKDNIAVSGELLTCGSRILESYCSPFHATAVERLLGAGAVLVGHTNMDEFGMGSSCENSAFFPSRNPWDVDRVPGGSSGGSAAAVAARTGPVGTGLRYRRIRPTAGGACVASWDSSPATDASRAMDWSPSVPRLDQIGPLATTVADAALCLGVDGWTRLARCDVVGSRGVECRSIGPSILGAGVIGVVREFVDELPQAVRANWDASLATLEQLGCEIVEVAVPSARATVATYYVLATSEASANLARFDGIRYGRRADSSALAELYSRSRTEGFGAEVKRRILLGTFSLSSGYYDAYYGKAAAVACQLRSELETALETCDVLATPTTPGPAFRIGELVDDPVAMYLSDVFTTMASLTGLPALAVPSGLSEDGMPLSLQVIGRPFAEAEVLGFGTVFESKVGPLVPAMAEWTG